MGLLDDDGLGRGAGKPVSRGVMLVGDPTERRLQSSALAPLDLCTMGSYDDAHER